MELAGVKRKRAVTFSQDSEDTLSPASAGSLADENTTGSTTPGLLPDDTRPPPPQRKAVEEVEPPCAGAGRGAGGAGGAGGDQLPSQNATKKGSFVFGNYDQYYGYRHSSQVPMDLDPRLKLLERSWIEDKSVLDIGCNSGALTFMLAERFGPRQIVGIDIDGHLINRAKRRLTQAVAASTPSSSTPTPSPTGPAVSVKPATAGTAARASAGGGTGGLGLLRGCAGEGWVARGVSKPIWKPTPATGAVYPHNLSFRAENIVARK